MCSSCLIDIFSTRLQLLLSSFRLSSVPGVKCISSEILFCFVFCLLFLLPLFKILILSSELSGCYPERQLAGRKQTDDDAHPWMQALIYPAIIYKHIILQSQVPTSLASPPPKISKFCGLISSDNWQAQLLNEKGCHSMQVSEIGELPTVQSYSLQYTNFTLYTNHHVFPGSLTLVCTQLISLLSLSQRFRLLIFTVS